MKNIFTLLIIAFYSTCALAQGIQFQEGNWDQVVAVAKQQNKPIFVDVYTAWCGPCKVMAKNIFPVAEVGAKFNAGFVNYKFDAEKGEGVALAKKYNVRAFPTFLFINPNDLSLIHEEVGALAINEFMASAEVALQKGGYKAAGKTSVAYQKAYDAGDRSPEFIVAFMQQNTLEKKDNKFLADALFENLPAGDRFKQPYISYLALNVHAVASPLFTFLAKEHQAVKGAINPGDALFFESAMIGATRTLAAYKGAADPLIPQSMRHFSELMAANPRMVESYYYGPLGRYYKNMKDTAGFMAMANEYANAMLFKITRAEMEKVDKAAIADAQEKLTSGEVDSAYFKAKMRNPIANREQASIRTSNLALDVARLATTKKDKQLAEKLIEHARKINSSESNEIMLPAVQHLIGEEKKAKKTLAKVIKANPKEEAEMMKRFETLTVKRG